jgi:methionyl-tRNA formyltransferase
MRTPTRIVVLIGAELVPHRYVARTLAQLDNVSIVIAEHPRRRLLKRVARAANRPWLVISRKLLKLALRVTGESARRQADLIRVLGDPMIPPSVRVYKTVGVNSPETQTLLRKLAPDILCVYGTLIVSDATLSIAPIALNLHTGMSPRYRGADCEFWPVHEGELNWIGATVHRCTSHVDGGAIYKTEAAILEPDDGLGAVFGRCVLTGSKLYKAVVQDLVSMQEVKTLPQELSEGREYKSAMRGWFAEIRVMRSINRGSIRDYVRKHLANKLQVPTARQMDFTEAERPPLNTATAGYLNNDER